MEKNVSRLDKLGIKTIPVSNEIDFDKLYDNISKVEKYLSSRREIKDYFLHTESLRDMKRIEIKDIKHLHLKEIMQFYTVVSSYSNDAFCKMCQSLDIKGQAYSDILIWRNILNSYPLSKHTKQLCQKHR